MIIPWTQYRIRVIDSIPIPTSLTPIDGIQKVPFFWEKPPYKEFGKKNFLTLENPGLQ